MGSKGFASLLLVLAGVAILSISALGGYFYLNNNPRLLQLQNDEVNESTSSATIQREETSTPSAIIKKDEEPIDGLKNRIVFLSHDNSKLYEYSLDTKNKKEILSELLGGEKAVTEEASGSAMGAIGSDDGTMLAIRVMKNLMTNIPRSVSLFYLPYEVSAPASNEYYIARSNGLGLQKLDPRELLKQYPDYNQLKISNWNVGEESLLLLASNSANPPKTGKTGFLYYNVASKQSKLLHEVNDLDVNLFNKYNPKTETLYFNVGRQNGEAYIEAINVNTKQQVAKFIYWTRDAITFSFSYYGDYLQMENNQFTAKTFNLFNLKNQQQPIKTLTLSQDGYHISPLGGWSTSGKYFYVLVQANDFATQDMYFYDNLGNFLMKAEAKAITSRKEIYSPDDTKILLGGISEQSKNDVWRFYEIRTGKEYLPTIESSDLGQPIVWY